MHDDNWKVFGSLLALCAFIAFSGQVGFFNTISLLTAAGFTALFVTVCWVFLRAFLSGLIHNDDFGISIAANLLFAVVFAVTLAIGFNSYVGNASTVILSGFSFLIAVGITVAYIQLQTLFRKNPADAIVRTAVRS